MDTEVEAIRKQLRRHFRGGSIIEAVQLEEGEQNVWSRVAAHFYFALAACTPEEAVKLLCAGLTLQEKALKSEGEDLPKDIHYDMDSLEGLRRDIARMAIPVLSKLEKT